MHGERCYRTRYAPTLFKYALAMNNLTHLGHEWQTLQNHHEQHERNALLIKLACLAIFVFGLAFELPFGWMALAVLLLWAQEGIVKTYQARLSDRLLRIEGLLQSPQPTLAPMQLHTEWAANRPGGAGLIASYALSACRPTVAFPYLPMLVAGWLWI